MSGCGATTPSVAKRLVTTTKDYWTYEPFTQWAPVTGVDKVKATLKRKSVTVNGTGSFKVKPVVQYAAVRTDDPESWSTLGGSEYSGDGDSCTGEIDISSDAASKFFVRFGVACKLDGASPTYGQADVALEVSYNACGKVAGGRTLQLQTNSTTELFHPVTGWVPGIAVEKVKAAIIITSDSMGEFECKLAYRSAEAVKEEPGEWSAIGASWYSPSSGRNYEANTGEISSLYLGSKMWVQFGIAHKLNTGSTLAYATVSTAVATRAT